MLLLGNTSQFESYFSTINVSILSECSRGALVLTVSVLKTMGVMDLYILRNISESPSSAGDWVDNTLSERAISDGGCSEGESIVLRYKPLIFLFR